MAARWASPSSKTRATRCLFWPSGGWWWWKACWHAWRLPKDAPRRAEQPDGEEGPAEERLSPEAIKGQAKALLAYLDDVPGSAELVLLEEDTVGSGPVLRHLQELARAGRATIVACEKPRRNDLPDWIRERAGCAAPSSTRPQ